VKQKNNFKIPEGEEEKEEQVEAGGAASRPTHPPDAAEHEDENYPHWQERKNSFWGTEMIILARPP
jgi:hypothetical protein